MSSSASLSALTYPLGTSPCFAGTRHFLARTKISFTLLISMTAEKVTL
ncbi:hypothetical protein PF008_g32548 [Phytophthora fragariae]|uniref:Uncharacterized protein n=1 Tax=Phytophthora fragariae TaxID=53985 RepID=A0A6G0PZG3_9STRA|nr:hypothetical protein PF008_g32548 [Phytophthora fragariae]